jgi:hypothetical protein
VGKEYGGTDKLALSVSENEIGEKKKAKHAMAPARTARLRMKGTGRKIR